MLNMSQRQTLRALVNDRLSAAAEEIFVLFERIIVDYEQQLCLYKEENQRKQGLLDSALAALGGSQIHSFSPGPAPKNQKIQETPQMEEAAAGQSVRRESEPVLTVPVPEFRVCVTRDASVFHQRQAEHRQETGQEDTNAVSHSGHFSNVDEDWESPFSWSVALMNTETNGLHYNQVQIRGRSTAVLNSGLSSKYKTTPEVNPAGNNGHMSLINQGTEKPFSCSTCKKTFTRKSTLKLHMRTHTGEKLFSCPICQKTFTRKSSLESHKRIHTGEKPFSCLTCKKTFVRNSALKMHIRTHKYLICKQISQHVPLQ